MNQNCNKVDFKILYRMLLIAQLILTMFELSGYLAGKTFPSKFALVKPSYLLNR